MTRHIGNSGKLKVDSTHFLLDLKSFSVDEQVATADSSAIDDADDVHLVGSANWNGSAVAYYNPADTNGQVILTKGASITLGLYPLGSGTGSPTLTGTATVEKVGLPIARNSTIEISFDFKGNGALAHSVVP